MRDEYRWHELARLHEIYFRPGDASDDYPLANMRIIKDLVPDLTHVFAQYDLIEAWLRTKTAEPEKERLQSPGGAKQTRWPLRVHSLLLLHLGLPKPLVERRPFPRARGAPPGEPVARRQSRRGDR